MISHFKSALTCTTALTEAGPQHQHVWSVHDLETKPNKNSNQLAPPKHGKLLLSLSLSGRS